MGDIENASGQKMRAAVHKAQILKALAHPVRICVFEALAQGEMTVGDIVAMTGCKEANTSRHLAVLRTSGLVRTRKEGLNVYYSNAMPCLLPMLDCISQAVMAIADEHARIACCLVP